MAKGKGSSFERQTAKKLSLWWSKGERDDIFWRSQSSGARATQRKKQGKETANQDGDLTATDVDGFPLIDLLSIELKRGYPDFTIEGLINKPNMKKSVFEKFVHQCQQEIANSDRMWWLVVKQDRREEILIFPRSFYEFLRSKREMSWKVSDFLELNYKNEKYVVIRFNEFLSNIEPDIFREGKK